MLSESSNEPGRQNQQDHVDTLGNPHASEADWLKANERLGENYKPKANSDDARTQRKKFLAEVSVLAGLGLGIFGLFTLSHPTNFTTPQPPDPPSPQAARPPASNHPPHTGDVDFGPYMADLQRTIKHHWYPPKGNETRRVVVIFKITKEGKVTNLRLDHTSGVKVADDAALKAIEDSAPEVTGLPEGAPNDVDIQFTFDYNVFNGGKAQS